MPRFFVACPDGSELSRLDVQGKLLGAERHRSSGLQEWRRLQHQ